MPLTPNFTAVQTITDPTILTLTDTSTGSDGGLTSRRIYLQKAGGSYLVETGTTTDYEVWAIGDSSIELDLLDRDYALNITVQWLTGSTVTYTKTILNGYKAYSEQFAYDLTTYQQSNPKLISNKNFYYSKIQLRCDIDDAVNAIELGNDITNAQAAFNRAKYLIDNPKLFF